MSREISKAERARLLRVATLLEGEANTWRDGFAGYDGVKWTWGKEEWAYVRYFKLVKAAEFVRVLAEKGSRT